MKRFSNNQEWRGRSKSGCMYLFRLQKPTLPLRCLAS